MNITFLKPTIMDGKKMKKGSSLEVNERRGKKMIDRGFAEYNQTTGKWQWKEHVTLTNYVTVTNWVSIANFLGVIDFEGTVITNQFQSLTVTNNGAVGIYTPNSGGAE